MTDAPPCLSRWGTEVPRVMCDLNGDQASTAEVVYVCLLAGLFLAGLIAFTLFAPRPPTSEIDDMHPLWQTLARGINTLIGPPRRVRERAHAPHPDDPVTVLERVHLGDITQCWCQSADHPTEIPHLDPNDRRLHPDPATTNLRTRRYAALNHVRFRPPFGGTR